MMRYRVGWVVVLCLSMGLTFGCRSLSPPVTYYTLSALAGPVAGADASAAGQITIGIQPVDLPGYVNRLQMVTRSGANRVSVSSLNRWADYPDRMVQQTIGENLQWLMPSVRVLYAQWPSEIKPQVVLSVQFLDLIGTDQGQVSLSAVWNLSGSDVSAGLTPRRTTISEPINGYGFDALAAAHSRAIGRLSREIAETIQKNKRLQ